MIEFARKYPIYIGFSSNLHYFDKEKALRLINSGLDEIAISIDGITQEVFEKYRANGNLNKVLKNALLLLNTRAKLNTSKPKIRWQFLVHAYNEHQMEDAKKLAKEMGFDEILFFPMYIDIENIFSVQPPKRINKFKDWLPKKEEFNLYDLKAGNLKVIPQNCHFLWDTAVVNWNGLVAPCCALFDDKYYFGDLKFNSFKKIWNNEKYQAARKLIGKKLKINEKIICTFCAKYGIQIY